MKLTSVAAVLLMAGATVILSNAQDRDASRDTQGRFTGAWRLASLEEQGSDGKVHKPDCSGLLVFSRDGHMSVQVMYRNAEAGSGAYAQGGYEATFGRYEVDDAHTFTFHVEGALIRTLIGKDLKRAYEISGNRLIVTSPDPDEHWKATWQRAK